MKLKLNEIAFYADDKVKTIKRRRRDTECNVLYHQSVDYDFGVSCFSLFRICLTNTYQSIFM